MGEPLDDVVAALLALLSTEPDENGVRMGSVAGLEDVRVFDGPPTDDVESGASLGIGVSASEAVAGFASDTPGWGGRDEESFDLACVVEAWTGDDDFAPQRARAGAVLRTVRAAIKADEQLGGSCDRAYVAGWQYTPLRGSGATAQIEFTVRVDATRFEGV